MQIERWTTLDARGRRLRLGRLVIDLVRDRDAQWSLTITLFRKRVQRGRLR